MLNGAFASRKRVHQHSRTRMHAQKHIHAYIQIPIFLCVCCSCVFIHVWRTLVARTREQSRGISLFSAAAHRWKVPRRPTTGVGGTERSTSTSYKDKATWSRATGTDTSAYIDILVTSRDGIEYLTRSSFETFNSWFRTPLRYYSEPFWSISSASVWYTWILSETYTSAFDSQSDYFKVIFRIASNTRG